MPPRAGRLLCIVILAIAGCAGTHAQQEYHDPPEQISQDDAYPQSSQPVQRADFTPAAPPPVNAILPDVLVVDDQKITVNDILEPLGPRLQEMANSQPAETYYSESAKIVRAQIVEQVAQHLIWRKANENVTDAMKPMIDKVVAKMEKERINREFNGRETLYEQHLTEHKTTRADVKEKLGRSILIDSYLRDRLLPQVPPPRRQELLDYYEKNKSDFAKLERRELLLIDVPSAAYLDTRRWATKEEQVEAEKKARAKIDEAAAALDRGETFSEVAKKYSQGLHSEDGGNWGMITAPPPGQTALQGHWEVPSRRLFELKPGQRSEIIAAAKSFFIVEVGKIEPGKQQTFQEAQPEIANRLRQDKFQRLRTQFLQTELEKSTIGSLEEFVMRVMQAMPKPAPPVSNR
jgi:parvulin-like peptidyl-prolyl isomerase